MEGSRRISALELSEIVEGLRKLGFQVPMLDYTGPKPVYIGETMGGMDIYIKGDRVLEVGPRQRIDCFGNVVDFMAVTLDTLFEQDNTLPIFDRMITYSP